MRTLVIYDSEGYIVSTMGGDVREPIGIPFLWTEVPTGFRAIGVNVTTEVHTVILEELPPSVFDVHTAEQLESELETDYRLSLLELGLV